MPEVRPIDANALREEFKRGVNVVKGTCNVSQILHNIDTAPTLDYEPAEYQLISKDFARFITKAIAQMMSELKIDLPSMIYEDIEHSLMNGKFEAVEHFINKYIANNSGAKMDEEQK